MQEAPAGELPRVRDVSGRALAGLTVAVLLAHALLLQNAQLVFDTRTPVSTRAFTTRTLRIEAAPPQAVAETATAVAPVVRAPVRRSVTETAVTASSEPVVAPPSAAQPAVVAQPETPRYDLAAQLVPLQPATPGAPSVPAATAALAPAAVASATSPAMTPGVALTKDAMLPTRSYVVPGSTRLKYNASGRQSRMDYTASGELLWQHDGSAYNARLEVSAFILGSRTFSSSGQLTADGLAPGRFADKARSEQAAHFDRARGRVSFSANTPEVALLPGAQDRISVFIQLAAMLAGEPGSYPPGTAITVQTVSRRAADVWVFTVEGNEKLSLPGGELTTVKLVCNPRKDFDQKIEVWLAPALGYLPARIRIAEANGDFVDQQWRSTASP